MNVHFEPFLGRTRIDAASGTSNEDQRFTDEELARIEAFWVSLTAEFSLPVRRIDRDKGMLRLDLEKDTNITVSRNSIQIKGPAEDDNTIRACLEHFKIHKPGRSLSLTGPDAFKLRAWLHAQSIGVAISNFRPTAEQLKGVDVGFVTDTTDPKDAEFRTWIDAKLRGQKADNFQPTPDQMRKLRLRITLPETPAPSGPQARSAPHERPAPAV
jgi:hypothetical protein